MKLYSIMKSKNRSFINKFYNPISATLTHGATFFARIMIR